jgi:hypothetical protein
LKTYNIRELYVSRKMLTKTLRGTFAGIGKNTPSKSTVNTPKTMTLIRLDLGFAQTTYHRVVTPEAAAASGAQPSSFPEVRALKLMPAKTAQTPNEPALLQP